MKKSSLNNPFRESKVRGDDGALLIVHHLTREWGFHPNDIAPFTHFGTRHAGRERIFDRDSARQISGLLRITNPLELPDPGRGHDLTIWLDLVSESAAGEVLDTGIYERIEAYEQETGEGLEMLAGALKSAGWDGIHYENTCEDAGSSSWVILDPDQLLLARDGRAVDNVFAWELEEEDFIGPSMVLDCFEIDGRDENYDFLWEDLDENKDRYPAVARDAQDYEARWLPDWDPAATIALVAPDGKACGFYMGAQLWIDEDHRGKGLSRLMIAAAADLLGGQPTQNTDGLGFSEAGYRAHISTYRKIRAEAEAKGHLRTPEGDQNSDFDFQP